MRRLYDEMKKGDLTAYTEDYPSTKEAKKFIQLAKRVAPNARMYIRRGTHVVVKTRFSAEAWALTFSAFLSTCRKLHIKEPDFIWKLAGDCVKHARAHKTWYPLDGERRIECKELLAMVSNF